MSIKLFKNILGLTIVLMFLACSFFTPQSETMPNAADLEKEEQAVYSFFVSGRDTALILKDTSTNILGNNPQEMIDSVKSGFKDVSDETLKSYVGRNQEPGQLSPDMDLGVKYELLSTEELAQVTSQPASGGYFMFSRVGFNNALDQALVYVGEVAGPLAGSGSYYLMEKKDGEWIVKEYIMVWIS